MNTRIWILFAGLFGAAGVALGAFHAHGMDGMLEEQGLSGSDVGYRLDLCETSVRYMLIQATALMGMAILSMHANFLRTWRVVGTGFILGTILFSGSLLAIAFTGLKKFGMIAPIGGVTLILSWLLFAASAYIYKPVQNH